MKRPTFITISLYLLGLISLLLYAFLRFNPNIFIGPMGRIAILGSFCLFTYSGSRLLSRDNTYKREKIMKYTFSVYFILYMSLLLDFTLFDTVFSRIGTAKTIFSDYDSLRIYLDNSLNLIPFATIILYIRSFINHTSGLSVIVTNLLGNLIALMPMALFLPIFFKRCRKIIPFTVATAAVVIMIELLQLTFGTGSCDIDDLILNLSGAVIAFVILNIRPVRSVLMRIIMIEH